MVIRVIPGDCRAILPTLPDASVQCCVTSPPYYGLRDYGVDGQIGLEPTPDEYVAEMVAVFREVRRVLRDDGTLFLNIGDSYFANGPTTGGASPKSTLGGGGGRYREGSKAKAMFETSLPRARGQRADACGTSGKEPEGSQAHDCLCGNLCDACRKAYRTGISHSGSLHAPTLGASTHGSIRAHTGSQHDHLPTSDCAHPADHSAYATHDPAQVFLHEAEPPPCVPASTTLQCDAQPHQTRSAASTQDAGCQLCGATLPRCAHVSADKAACTCGIASRSAPSSPGMSGTASSDLASPSYTTKSPAKPKDLLGIPWLLAFALRADGWYLRSDIIWHKPNPMPESVTDRPTSAHEHVFLLTKQARYFYDAAAIAEAAEESSLARLSQDVDAQTGSMRANGGGKTNGPMRAVGGATRNARNVWTIATQPYSGAHFATMPPELAERCIKAGTKPGDTVLDPFGGAGTTGLVADRLGRSAVLIELNPAYQTLATDRVQDDAPLLFVRQPDAPKPKQTAML